MNFLQNASRLHSVTLTTSANVTDTAPVQKYAIWKVNIPICIYEDNKQHKTNKNGTILQLRGKGAERYIAIEGIGLLNWMMRVGRSGGEPPMLGWAVDRDILAFSQSSPVCCLIRP